MFFVGGFVLIAIGVILAAFIAMSGHRRVDQGIDTMHCSSSTLLDVVLSGTETSGTTNEAGGFVGILDLIREIDSLLDKLDDESKFMTRLMDILLATKPLEKSVKMLTSTLTLLDETMAHPDNTRPKSNSGKPLDHICHFCEAVAGSVAPLSKEIEDSMATALDKTRGEVKSRLTGEKLVKLRKDLDEGIEPLLSSKDSLRDSIGAFVEGDFADTIDGIIGLIGLVVLALFGIAIPILCCDGSAVCCAAFKARTKDDQKYRTAPKNCACCGWCFGWVLAFIGLFLGGILMAVMTPVSGVCLIMMDVNKENLLDWGPALGLADDPKSFKETVDIIDECLGETSKGAILEAIKVTSERDGETVRISLREEINSVQEKVNEKFDELTEKSKTQTGSMDDSKAFKDLLKFLDTDVSKLTTFDPEKIEGMKSKPEFAGFALAPKLSTTAFTSSAACVDFTIDKSGPLKDVKLDGTIPGLKSLQTQAEAQGLVTTGLSCDDGFVGGDKPLRDAVNEIMQIKRDLRKSNRYKCNLFMGPGNQVCDPKEFKKTGKDCVQEDADGKLFMKTKEISCSYSQFVQYVKDFKERIDIATKEVEFQSTALVPAISTNLKRHVNDELFDDMFGLLDNNRMNCKFMGDAYWSMVDGLCHQAARGISEMSTAFVVMGGLVLGLVILMYITYRRVVDNREVSANAVKPLGDDDVVPGGGNPNQQF